MSAVSETPKETAQRRRWAIVAAAAVLAAIWLAMLIGGTGTLDRSIYEALYAGHRPLLLSAARFFTALGEPTPLVIAGFLVAALLWWRGRGRFALGLLLVIMVGRALSELQKFVVGRPRPAIEPHLVVVKTHSFPSGHATSSMIFYLTVAIVLFGQSRWKPTAVAAAVSLSLLIGLSRVMLGVHWPSDVIAGWAFGMMWALLTLVPAERLFGARSPNSGEPL